MSEIKDGSNKMKNEQKTRPEQKGILKWRKVAQTFLNQHLLETEQNKRKKDKWKQTYAQLWCLVFAFTQKLFFLDFLLVFLQAKKKNN